MTRLAGSVLRVASLRRLAPDHFLPTHETLTSMRADSMVSTGGRARALILSAESFAQQTGTADAVPRRRSVPRRTD
jgi:hypothetical protein